MHFFQYKWSRKPYFSHLKKITNESHDLSDIDSNNANHKDNRSFLCLYYLSHRLHTSVLILLWVQLLVILQKLKEAVVIEVTLSHRNYIYILLSCFSQIYGKEKHWKCCKYVWRTASWHHKHLDSHLELTVWVGWGNIWEIVVVVVNN